MSVTPDEVRRMAELARLELDGDEADELLEDLNGILEHMESLAGADVEPAGDDEEAHREGPAPLRDGSEGAPDRLTRSPEELAPAWEEGFFVVPRLPAVEGGEEEGEGRAP